MTSDVRGLKTGRILVFDDYEDARVTIRELLEENGYEVIEAAHGQEALHLLVSNLGSTVRLILLDLQMPIMDGWQFLRVLSNYTGLRRIPVLITSAHPPRLDGTAHQAVVGVLHAPYAPPQLVAMVDACLTH
jgi:CheY-like chemotaxis protein